MAMERVTVEQNGERFTLEVPEGTTDDQIRAYLTEQQGGGINQPEPNVAENVAGQAAIAAAPTATKLTAGMGQAVLNAPVTALTAPITSPISTAKNVAGAIERLVPQVPTQVPVQGAAAPIVQSMPGTRAMNVGELLKAGAKGIGQSLVAPESAFLMPYNMAAYEQAKIRANPTAPGLEYNPYAQTVRGEVAPVGNRPTSPKYLGDFTGSGMFTRQNVGTQGQAGEANRMRALTSMPYGNVTPEERARLEEDAYMRNAIRKKAFQKVMGPVAPGNM